MLLLVTGLVVFLGIHSVRMLAPQWREGFISDRSELAYKALYSVLSLIGLVLVVIGYGQTRAAPHFLWFPPAAMALVAALLMLVSFVLLAAAYVPGNRIKAAVGHPMVLGVKVWAFSHLLVNGRLSDIILFSAFLFWAVINYVKSRKADRANDVVHDSAQSIARDSITVVVGVGAWLVFSMWVHVRLIGVSPFGA